MPQIFSEELKTPTFTGKISVNTGLYINGRWVDPVGKETIKVINPTDEKVITTVAVASAEDVDLAVRAAEAAFKTSWGTKVSGSERGRLLNKLADLIEKNTDELAAIEAIDCGKTYMTAKHVDMSFAVQSMRYLAGWADKNHGKTIESDESKFTYTRHEPVGVCGCIVPWNFPFLITSWKIATALATGNTVVLKPSEITPLSTLKLADLIAEAGFPPGVVNVVTGYGNVAGQALTEHPLVRKVSFTGSTVTGRRIMETSSKTNLKRVTLELGGKSPNVIFDDADLDQVVKWAIMGIFHHSGQLCAASSRIFVQEGIYDQFMEAFAAASQSIKPGNIFDPSTTQGPVVSKIQFDRVMDYITSGKNDGAKVHCGGVRVGDEGYYIQPTIFTDTKPSMKIVQEEIFGPVAVVIKFKDEAEAVAMANDTTYGLAGSVFTKDFSRATRFANALEAGSVYINMTPVPDFRVPIGGVKQSGYGRELGEYALEAFTTVKAVHVNVGMQL